MVNEIFGLVALIPFASIIKFGVKNRILKLLPFCSIFALTYLGYFSILSFQPIVDYSLLTALVTCFSAHIMYGLFITKKLAGVELEMYDFLIYPVFVGVGFYASIQPLSNNPVSYLILIGLLSAFCFFIFIQIRRFGKKIIGENVKASVFWKVCLLEIGFLVFILSSRIISELSLFWWFFSIVSILQIIYGILLWK